MGSIDKTEFTLDQFKALVSNFGFSLNPNEEADYLQLLRDSEWAADYVQQLPEYFDPRLEPDLGPMGQRTFEAPTPGENPLNAWMHRTELKSSKPIEDGLLSGRTIAVKDNISVAAIPLTCGTQPYHLSRDTPFPIPNIDAPVIKRALEAGGVIKGTATCENYCMSAMSCTSATGPVHNPWLKGYQAGGSSSGNAALIAIKAVRQWKEQRGLKVENDDRLGEGVDLAIGGDQGGSIRLPAAYSGIYGLKPTHGLVPYTGIAGVHPAIDHCGPMAGSIQDVALLLTVLAGYDGIDPRMTPETPLREKVPQYHQLLDQAIQEKKAERTWTPSAAAIGLRIGIVKEAFQVPGLSEDVKQIVHKAANRFRELGGEAVEVSIPLHAASGAIFTAATRAHVAETFLENSAPTLLSHPMPNLMPRVPDQKWVDTMNASAPMVVNALFTSKHFSDTTRFPQSRRAKAIMHMHQLRAAYDAVLDDCDVLITPANPTVGKRLPKAGEGSVKERADFALSNTANTTVFNLTGHPGLVIPVGWGKVEDGDEKLPIGMQIIGRRWDESKVLFAASAWEVGGLGLDNE